MGLFQAQKPKSAGKIMLPAGEDLTSIVVETLNHMAAMAGKTLGPGGRAVLIERPEMGMKPIITKDGVTVIKNLGYGKAIQQLILESARDAALRTAEEAGDGTTTATILASAITKYTNEAVKANPKTSPQRIVREMADLVPYLKNEIMGYAIPVDDNFEEILERVATLSANGDIKLAKTIIEAFNLVGEEGNLTIVEGTGPSRYTVERITGYTVDTGYEESAKKFSQGFINDRSGTMVGLEHPVFVLYDGVINDISQIFEGLQKISFYFDETASAYKNIVVVAHGFSDMFLADMHTNWNTDKMIKIFPLLTPQNAILNWRTQFLYDLQAYTGAPVFNPLDRPFSDVNPKSLVDTNLVTNFEAGRFRTSIISKEDEFLISERINELKLQLEKPESEYEANDLRVRIGKLSSGIARLVILAPSQGETRERRDRAEDAWMAIRGAIKTGACPAGGYVLVRLAASLAVAADSLTGSRQIAAEILSLALLEPVHVLYKNYGYTDLETEVQRNELLLRDDETFDISEQKWVPKFDLLDSVPAVSEAIESSISIASLLGTLGGIISFSRDQDTDKYEERLMRDFNKAIEGEPA